MVFTSDGSRNKEIDTRIGKANAVQHELYCSMGTKRELSNTTKLSIFKNRSLFRSSPVVLKLRWQMKKYCQKNKRERWDICEEFSVWHFVTKSTGLKSVKPGTSSHFSESRDPSHCMLVWPYVPGKNGEIKSFGLESTPTGKRPRGRPSNRWRD